VIMQKLLDEGLADTGIVACKTFDGDMIDTIFTAHDNLNIVSILSEDGQAHHRVIGSVAEALRLDGERPEDLATLFQRFEAPSLQMVSFTITEKGHEVKDADGQPLPLIQKGLAGGPEKPVSTLGIATAGLYHRYLKGQMPVAMVSTDNASMNGDKLHAAIRYIAEHWVQQHGLPQAFLSSPTSTRKSWSAFR
jgi:fructuronate reductase